MSAYSSSLHDFKCGAAVAGLLALAVWTLPGTASAAPDGSASTAGSGLRASGAAWPRWQGRLMLGTAVPSAGAVAGGPYEPVLQSASLVGDYYFVQQGLVPSRVSGGFRASGGVLWGSRTAQWSLLPGPAGLGSGFSAERRSFGLVAPALGIDAADPASSGSVPYLGVGYTGLSSIKGTGGGWGFSADVGVMALQPHSAVRLGQQSLGEVVRDLQLSPLLQLGVSYSF